MRRPNRDTTVFSTSAIDLFASALGAFILLVMILFPYYRNEGSDDAFSRTQEIQDMRRLASGEIADLLAERLPSLRLRHLDRAFAERAKWKAFRRAAAKRGLEPSPARVDARIEPKVTTAEKTVLDAVASEMAAELYGLSILQRNIEDQPDNTTRFLVIGDRLVSPSGDDKTSVLISVRNKPGALYAMLKPIAEHGISMSRIESRPSRRGNWDYVFFVDIQGHREDPEVAAALDTLRSEAGMYKELGSYPNAVL